MHTHAYILNIFNPTISFSVVDAAGRSFNVSVSLDRENNGTISVTPTWFTVVTGSLYYNTGKFYSSASYVDVTISIDTADPSLNTESVYRFTVYSMVGTTVYTDYIYFYPKSFEINQQIGVSEIWSARYSSYSGTVQTVTTVSALVDSNRSFGFANIKFIMNSGTSLYYISSFSQLKPINNVLNGINGASFSFYAVVGTELGTFSNPSAPIPFLSFKNSEGTNQLVIFQDRIFTNSFNELQYRTGIGFLDQNGTYSSLVLSTPISIYGNRKYKLNFFEVHCYGNTCEFYANGIKYYTINNASTGRNISQVQWGAITTISKWFVGDVVFITGSLSLEEKRRIRRKLFYLYDIDHYQELENPSYTRVYDSAVSIGTPPVYTISYTLSVYSPADSSTAYSYTLSGDSASEIWNGGVDIDAGSYFEFVSNSIIYATVSASINPGETHTYIVHWINPGIFSANLWHIPAWDVTVSQPTLVYAESFNKGNYAGVIVTGESAKTQHRFYNSAFFAISFSS